jgi:DNA gyrase subunit A
MTHIQGPDFPGAGYIFDQKIIQEVYATGRGSIPVRGKADIDEFKANRMQITITELPYQVNKANLVMTIARLVNEKKIDGISDLRDESDRAGMRIAIELKRDAKPKKVLNQLYKFTQLQTTFPCNMVALVNGTPQLITLKQALLEYLIHRQTIIIRRSQFELRNARYRAHILEGLKIALDHIDEIIETIKKSKDTDNAKTNLMSKFGLSELQAVAILDMQLRRLSGLERQKIEDEYNQVMAYVSYLEDLLRNPVKIIDIIDEDLKQLKKDFGDDRRTVVIPSAIGEFNEEDLIPKERTVITVTQSGYLKRLAPSTFRSQRRGGKGVSGMTTKDEDDIAHLKSAFTHDYVLFFTDHGRVFKLKVWEIPEGSRTSKGQAVINLLNIEQDEQIQAMLTVTPEDLKDNGKYILLCTRRGMVKKTSVSQFANIRTNGLIAIKLSSIPQSSDRLVWASLTGGDDHILMVSHNGKSIRFSEKDIRPTGRDTMGVIGIKFKKDDDYVVGMEILPLKFEPPIDKRKKFFQNILVVMEKGLGKQTKTSEFPLQNRGGQGVKVANVTAKTGKIVSARLVSEAIDQIVLTTKSAQIIKLPLKNIPAISRATQGVILMRPKSGDQITATTLLAQEDEPIEE